MSSAQKNVVSPSTSDEALRPTEEVTGDGDEEYVPLKSKAVAASDKEVAGHGSSKFIYVLAFFSAIGGFLFGYDTGVVSGAMLIIRKEMELSNAWHEAIVSATIAAAWLFALVAGYLSDLVGRKPVILSASVVFAVGSVVMGAADGKVALLVGRIIVGVGIGAMSSTVAVYIAESSPTSIRGPLVALQSVLITFGRFSGALASAVAFQLDPPTSRKVPVMTLFTKGGRWYRNLKWLDVFDFSSRRPSQHGGPYVLGRSGR